MFKDILDGFGFASGTDRNSPVSYFPCDQLNNQVVHSRTNPYNHFNTTCSIGYSYTYSCTNSIIIQPIDVAKTETSHTQCVMKLKPCSSKSTQMTAIINKD